MSVKPFKLYLLTSNRTIKEMHAFDESIKEDVAYFKNDDSNINMDNVSKKVHKLPLYGDDTIENIKYKVTSVLNDKNSHNYCFFYREHNENIKELFEELCPTKKGLTKKNLKDFV